MIKKLFSSVMILALALAFAAPAQAQTHGLAYVTSITYQNLSATQATLVFTFYAQASSTVAHTENKTLNGYAAGSLAVGTISQISAGFKGSTVMSSDQPVAATLVQVPPGGSASKARPLSNGFSSGSPTVLIGTAVKKVFSSQITHIISVQNTDSITNDISIAFYASGNPVAVDTDVVTNLPPGAAQYFDLATDVELADGFNGSAVVTAVKSGSANPGSIVASAMELTYFSGTAANAFEGVSSGGTTVYMPSALCRFGAAQYASFYAIQNTSSSVTATVTATYSPGGYTQTAQIPAYGKFSFQTCLANGLPAAPTAYNGAATITSDQPIIVIGKVNGAGLATAFLGASTGTNKVALPYVRWANDANFNVDNSAKQRTFITIQNVGVSTIPMNTITVKYYDPTGAISSTHTINVDLAPGGKAASNPNTVPNSSTYEFGYVPAGGSAIIEGPAGSKLSVVARVQSVVTVAPAVVAGEDYNGIPVP